MRSQRIRHDVLLGLIDQAYAAAEAPPLWENFLRSLADSVNGRAAGLLQHDLTARGQVNVAVRADPAGLRLYDGHFNRLDPWAAGVRLLGPGVVATDEMLVPTSARGTEYFNDFAVHYDFTRLLTVAIARHTGTNAVMSVLRGNADAPFESSDRRLVKALVPHVTRALDIHQRIVDAHQERAVAVEALDAVRCAVFLVDAEAKVVLANRSGREMLAANDGLSTDRSRLAATDPRATASLRHLCAAAASKRSSESCASGGMVALVRSSGRLPLQALVAPTASTEPLGFHDDRVAALVFVSDPADEQMPSETLLRELYGLTAAEAHVAARIAVGWSLRDIAAERGSALETVRRQTKLVLAKTGARHRSDLVRRLSTMVPRIRD